MQEPDRLYLASEVFLRESLLIAEREQWSDFPHWALRCRMSMQVRAVARAHYVSKKLHETEDIQFLLEGAASHAIADLKKFRQQVALGDAARERAMAMTLLDAHAASMAGLPPRIAQEIENNLVHDHRRMMVAGYSRWRSEAPSKEDITEILEHSTAGLALSGGGIRSASYCLGVVNGLASRQFLPLLHYISGVSGGGYISSWLTAWAYRNKGGARGIQKELNKAGADCAPIHWIRRYGSYLCPRPGVMATDVWSLIVSYVRNWFPILVLLLLLTSACLFVPHLVAVAGKWIAESRDPLVERRVFIGSLCTFFLLLALMRYLTLFKRHQDNAEQNRAVPWTVAIGTALVLIVFTLVAPTLLKSSLSDANRFTRDWGAFSIESEVRAFFAVWILLYFAASMVGYAVPLARRILVRFKAGFFWLARLLRCLFNRTPAAVKPSVAPVVYLARVSVSKAMLSAGLGALCSAAIIFLLLSQLQGVDRDKLVGICPLVFVFAFGLAEIVIAILMEQKQLDVDRAWAARLGGWILGACVIWTSLSILSLGAPRLAELVDGKVNLLLLSSAVLATTVTIAKWMKRLTTVIPAVICCTVLLICFTACVIDPAMKVMQRTLLTVAVELLACLVLGLAILAYTDVNRFSLHAIYREGLVRTFLGSSRLSPRSTDIDPPTPLPAGQEAQFKKRNPDPATNLDEDDDPYLDWLMPNRIRNFPFLLLNAAVNGRSTVDAEGRFPRQWPFTFSPLFCGSPAGGIGYAPTRLFFRKKASDKGLTLGTAMAVSGAAISPASGRSTHPVRAFLLSILNARLGLWIGNPSHPTIREVKPRLPLGAILKDFFGIRSRFAPWIHLSDGGHFENLGLYELVRRGCRCIVLVDASCDPASEDSDLGNAIRRIRIDLGIRVVARKPQSVHEAPDSFKDVVQAAVEKTAPLDSKETANADEGVLADTEFVSWRIFDIEYGPGWPKGKILYLKPTISKDDTSIPADVKNYSLSFKSFPHETTADQFFTEAQMEAYRALGEKCAQDAYRSAIIGKDNDNTLWKYFSGRVLQARLKETADKITALSTPLKGPDSV